MTQLTALILSIAVEALVASVLMHALGWGSAIRGALAASAGTLVTHWAVWWSVPWLADNIGYMPALIAVETVVVLVESVAYRLIVPLRMERALFASFVANGASTTFGLALYALNLA